jgi:hypothetical protein
MKNKQKYTPVRFSHLMSYAGVGAIVRGAEDKLMAVTDIRYWTDKSGNIASDVIPYVTRVTMALNINKELRMPPKAQENERDELDGNYLSTVLFPTYAKCQKCGLLHNNPWRKKDKRLYEDVFCESCDSSLEQITWCAVSNKGYMSEVPWHYIAHQNSESECRVDFESSYLRFSTDSNGKRIVFCTRCKSKNYYENSKTNVINGLQPWIYEKAPKLDEDDIVEILEVNNPGVYLPERVNALVIPPESRISKTSVIDRLYNNSKLRREIDNIRIPLRKKGKLKEAATEYRCSVDDIQKALEEIKAGYPYFEENITLGELIEDEYKAFLLPIDDVADDEDFVTTHKTDELQDLKVDAMPDELKAIIDMVDNHIIATRLREIQVFKGFYRAGDEHLVPPDIVGESNWFPAIELFGEGIFFTINEKILSKWEGIPSVRKRADEILKRYEKSEVNLHTDVEITPRFLLLHTLSHLLIRELESTAGYPAASLKERIYSSRDRNMSGILVFTTVADIVGSLGGIVESAEPKEFLSLMDGVFKHAQWCSLDPVCTEHEGQGPGWLNRAACHACALIPEPSCDYGNVFLDRVFVKGSEQLGIPNFLEFVNNEREIDNAN